MTQEIIRETFFFFFEGIGWYPYWTTQRQLLLSGLTGRSAWLIERAVRLLGFQGEIVAMTHKAVCEVVFAAKQA